MIIEGADFQQWWVAFLLAMPRFVGIAIFTPFLRAPQVPPMVRNIFIFTLALIVMPLIWHETKQGLAGHMMFALVLKEALIGVIIGFILSLSFLIPQAIGAFIDNQRGASIASVFDPSIGGHTSPLGLFLSHAFLVWFIAAGGMILFIDFVMTSFKILPVMVFLPKTDLHLWNYAMDAFGIFIKLTFIISGPVIFSMLISEIALGFVSRFAPQLNVFFLSMSLKSIVGIFILLLYMSNLLGHVWREGLMFETGYLFLQDAAQ